MTARADIPSFDPEVVLAGNVPRIDFQMHTDFTDGKDKVSDHFKAAKAMRLEAIAFTEHVSRNETWMREWYPTYRAEVLDQRARVDDLRVLLGIEAKAADYEGTLNVADEIIDESEIVLGVVHAFPKSDEVQYEKLTDVDPTFAMELELRAMLGLLENERVDVAAHTGGVCIKHFGSFPSASFEKIIEKAAARGVLFEINSSYHKTRVRELLEMCVRHGARVTLGSDAHTAKRVGDVVGVVEQEVCR